MVPQRRGRYDTSKKPGRRPARVGQPGPDELFEVLGGRVVEGRRAVVELLRAKRRPVRAVYLASGAERSSVLEEIAELARRDKVPLRLLERAELERRSRTAASQGVLAEAEPLEAVALDELIVARNSLPPFLLVLDGITDPQNLGALLRSALGAGVTGVVVRRHRAVHLSPAALKAAAGAAEYLPIAVASGIPAAITTLRRAGVWCVGLDAQGSETIEALTVADAPLALVLGAEGSGLSPLVKQRCDVRARIPLSGPISSLNVAAAGAVACFFVATRRRELGSEKRQPAG